MISFGENLGIVCVFDSVVAKSVVENRMLKKKDFDKIYKNIQSIISISFLIVHYIILTK